MNIFAVILAVAVLISGLCKGVIYLRNSERKIISTQDGVTSPDQPFNQVSQEWIKTCASLFPVLTFVLLLRSFGWEPFHIPSGSMTPTLLTGDFVIADKFSYGFKNPFNQRTLIQRGHPQRGDIAIFHSPLKESELFIKRVIGLPGDHVMFDPVSKSLSIFPASSWAGDDRPSLQISYTSPKSADHSGSFSDGQHLMQRYESLGGVTHKIQQDAARTVDTGRFFRQKGLPAGEWVVPDGQYFMMGDNRDDSYDSRYWGFVPERNLVGKAVGIWFSLIKQTGLLPVGIRLSRIGHLH